MMGDVLEDVEIDDVDDDDDGRGEAESLAVEPALLEGSSVPNDAGSNGEGEVAGTLAFPLVVLLLSVLTAVSRE